MPAPQTIADLLGHPDAVTCAHVTPKGLRCLRTPADGQAICVLHGASIPQAADAIQRKLLALQEKSIATAEELLISGDDKIRATVLIAIWDRTGLGPKSTLTVNSERPDLSPLSMQELAAEFDRLGKLARAEAARRNSHTQEALLTLPAGAATH